MKFSNRHEVQEYLTSQTKQGAIVELGCGYGNGVRAMCAGNVNELSIYSIDPYLPYSDPLGGKYDEDTRTEMLLNTRGLNFTHLHTDAFQAARDWDVGIGMLWLDLSMSYENLMHIIQAWEKWLLPEGYLAITGLEYRQVGTRRVYEELCLNGYEPILEEQKLVAVLRKK